MGCTSSALVDARKSAAAAKHAAKVDDPEAIALQAPPPRITVEVSSSVLKYTEGQCVVFIFGGPGSMKGAIIEELVSEFGFVAITTEEIVLNYLPNKVANTVETTHEIQEMIRNDPNLLTLEWILHLISAKLSTSSQKRFLIDIVPNWISILKVSSFLEDNHQKELASFERRQKVQWAISLNVQINDVVNSVPGIAMKMPEKSKEAVDDKQKRSSFQDGSDEADTNRMKRRNEQYAACAKPFIDYFSESRRLISVDVVPHQKHHVWKRLRDLLQDYGLSQSNDTVFVVLFAFNEEQVEGLDPVYYKMLKVRLSSILAGDDDSVEASLGALKRYINRSASSNHNHLVILDRLKMTPVELDRSLNFLEVRECYLDHFIKLKSTTVKGRPFKKPFKAISTTDSQVCLFAAETPTDVCKTVAHCFSRPVDARPADDKASLTATSVQSDSLSQPALSPNSAAVANHLAVSS